MTELAAAPGVRPSPVTTDGARVRASARTLVHAAVAVWAAAFAGLAVLRHAAFESGRFDLGNMTQAVWSTAHGQFLETTSASGEQFARIGAHADPLLALFAAPWLAWPSPLMLVVVQAIGLAAGALPVFWLARKHLGSDRVAARFALAYLLFPALQWNAHADFHPVSLAVPLLLFAIWYLDEDRLLPFALFAVAAATTKEHVPLLVGCLGLWYASARGRRAPGLAIFGLGAAWSAVATLVVVPAFAPAGAHLLDDRFAGLGASPGAVAAELLTWNDARFVVLLLVPMLALWAREPLLAACALPELGLDLLSAKEEQTSIMFHYSAGVIPFVVAASVLGAARLDRERLLRRSRLLVAVGVVCVFVSPMLFAPWYAHEARSPENAARRAAVALVPSAAPVSATNELGAHLSERSRIFSFPTLAEAEWIVVDVGDPTIGDRKEEAGFRRRLGAVERDPSWLRVFDRDGVRVYSRSAGRTTTDAADRVDGPWKTASTLLPSGSST